MMLFLVFDVILNFNTKNVVISWGQIEVMRSFPAFDIISNFNTKKCSKVNVLTSN